MKKLFVSLDWDYFIDATENDMEACFPAASIGNAEHVCSEEWREVYDENPRIFKMNPRPEYHNLLGILETFGGRYDKFIQKTHLCVSHRDMYGFVLENMKPEDTAKLLHVDFHHDCFMGMSELDCSNWLRNLVQIDTKRAIDAVWFAPESQPPLLQEDYLSSVFSLVYIRPEASPAATFDCMDAFMPFEGTLEAAIKDREEVYVLLCRSDPWTPPHLDRHYFSLSRVLRNYSLATESVFDSGAYGNIKRWKK